MFPGERNFPKEQGSILWNEAVDPTTTWYKHAIPTSARSGILDKKKGPD
jgi:hypothetical protein